MRSFVVAANWKMHKNPVEAAAFFKTFLAENRDLPAQAIFFVPAIDLYVAAESLRGTSVGWGAQNCHFEFKGAFTGENSPQTLADIGAGHCLVGHSERRAFFHETLLDTAKKLKSIQECGLVPMLCVGESLEQREAGETEAVILSQLREGLSLRIANRPFMIAYEPVWAIGTGKVATPRQAGEAHSFLRQALSGMGGAELAEKTCILYGGSVKPDNAAEISAEKDIDGFLVGGASLEAASFLSLCRVSKGRRA
jgi:triosephosphate isomerase